MPWLTDQLVLQYKGGPTSGNFGHKGRPGIKGGSMPGGGHGAIGAGAGSDMLKAVQNYRAQKKKGKGKEIADIGLEMDAKGKAFLEEVAKIKITYEEDSDFGWADVEDYQRKSLKNIVVTKIGAGMVSSSDVQPIYPIVNRMVGQWADTAADTDMRSLDIQRAAAEELGIPKGKYLETKLKDMEEYRARYDETGKKYTDTMSPLKENYFFQKAGGTPALIREMYDQTQAQLQAGGYKPGETIRLYRGLSVPFFQKPDTSVGTEFSVTGNPLESWSLSSNTAKFFMGTADQGLVLAMDVPIEKIVSTPGSGFGCLNETEFVIMGSTPRSAIVVHEK